MLSPSLFALCTLLILGHMQSSTDSLSVNNDTALSTASPTSKPALDVLFNKYGRDGYLSFEGFEHLLFSLGLGNINYLSHNISDHHMDSKFISGLHNGDHHHHIPVDHDHEHEHDHDHDHHDHEVAGVKAEAGIVTNGTRNTETHKNVDSAARVQELPAVAQKCLDTRELMNSNGRGFGDSLTEQDFIDLCPTLVLQLDAHICGKPQHDSHDHFHSGESASDDSHRWHSASVWGYSFLACLIISAVGLVAVAIIPIMHKVIYNHLLQFLVALAVGSLTGDAILHLLPHAMSPHDEHHVPDHGGHDKHAVWCGLTALSGIYLFFLVERVVGMCSERKRAQNERRLKRLEEAEASVVDQSLLSASPRMSSSLPPIGKTPVISRLQESDGGGVGTRLSRHAEVATSCEEILMMVHTNKDVRKFAHDARDEVHQHCDPKARQAETWGQDVHSSVGHNHSHSAPGSIAAVAWMVIFGDGFHNFADGLAIGSAFANSLAGGLSTAIAVFCHELPHELGDFAMLLNAGMSAKQALVYNCVSSLLCMVGMIVGVVVGNVATATTWIFALVAGLFLYIALVDMLPEMTSMDPKKGEHPLLHLILQNSGMLLGVSIMLVIALYEDQLQKMFGALDSTIFNNSSSTTVAP